MENQEPVEEGPEQVEDARKAKERDLTGKLDKAGWGLFFVWVGIAFLADLDTGVGLLGVGIIALGEQALRKFLGVKVEGFWVVVGLCFVVGGLWDLFEARLPLVPIALIVGGALLLFSIFSGKRGEGG